MSTVTLYDAVTAANVPSDALAVAGYRDGLYPSFDDLAARFPNAVHIDITVLGAPGCRVCDCESGDLTPEQAADWAHDELVAGRRPTIYCNKSTKPAVDAALAALGLFFGMQVDCWLAAWGDPPVIPAWCVAVQYENDVPPGYDVSVALSDWLVPKVTPPSPPVSYPDDVKRIDGQVTIAGGGGNITKAQLAGWDGSCPISVICWGSDNASPPLHFQSWSGDGRLDFTGTDGGPWGFSMWVTT